MPRPSPARPGQSPGGHSALHSPEQLKSGIYRLDANLEFRVSTEVHEGLSTFSCQSDVEDTSAKTVGRCCSYLVVSRRSRTSLYTHTPSQHQLRPGQTSQIELTGRYPDTLGHFLIFLSPRRGSRTLLGFDHPFVAPQIHALIPARDCKAFRALWVRGPAGGRHGL